MANKKKPPGRPKKKNTPRQIEATLRQNEEKYSAILEGIEEGFYEEDLAGNFTYVNEAMCRIYGYPLDEILGLNYKKYTDEATANRLYHVFNEIYKTGEPSRGYTYELTRKDGARRYIEASASLIKDSSGKPAGFRGIVRDVTERKKLDSALRWSEEKYRSILNGIQEAYFECDLAGRITFLNDALCRHLGYSKEELLGSSNRLYADKESRAGVFRAFAELYRTGVPIKAFDYKIIKKDGTVGISELSVSLIRDAEGNPTGFAGVSRDVTERKRMEEKLRRAEEKYRAMLESIQEVYFETDLAGKITYIPDEVSKHIGYLKEELMGDTIRKHTDEETFDRLTRVFAELYKTRVPIKTVDAKIIRKDGSMGFYEFSVSLVTDSEGKPTGFGAISRDVSERKRMEDAIRQSEERYRTIIEEIADGYFEIDLDGTFTFVNDAQCKNTGTPREQLLGRNNRDYTSKEEAKRLYRIFNEIYRTGEPVKGFAFEFTRRDGTKASHEVSVSLMRDSQGKPIGFRGVTRDVTERKRMEEAIRESEERYRTIIEEMEEWYGEIDLNGNILFANNVFAGVIGIPQKDLTGVSYRNFVKKEDADSIFLLFNQIYKTGMPVANFPYEFVKADGSSVSAELSIFPKRELDDKISGFRLVGHDVTERKRAEERIQYLATHDALTGLPNRMLFTQLLSHSIETARRHKRQIALFFIDLDRFKMINDSLGHDAGDQLLQEITRRIKKTLRASDIIARFGGDEFVILIEELGDLSQVTIVAHRILSVTLKPMIVMGEECRITASIGISLFPKDATDGQSLMKYADMAMYLAKEEGKNNFQFYAKGMKSLSSVRLSLETNLRNALERNELSLNYQAKLDFCSNAITGVEALLRWTNPHLGTVPPVHFIPVAEETGLIVPIGRWVLKTACEQNVAWQRQGLPPLCIAVNLSLRQLMDENLIRDIERALNKSGLAPNLLELEITESMVMHNPARMITILSNIKEMGVRLAIDDFGTGYSSLAHIKNFPIDTIKVDRSFIRNLPEDSEDKAITEAIIAMGKTLSLTVVAEGVETAEQIAFLRKHACNEMQGYYFSKPITGDQFAELLRSHIPSPEE